MKFLATRQSQVLRNRAAGQDIERLSRSDSFVVAKMADYYKFSLLIFSLMALHTRKAFPKIQ